MAGKTRDQKHCVTNMEALLEFCRDFAKKKTFDNFFSKILVLEGFYELLFLFIFYVLTLICNFHIIFLEAMHFIVRRNFLLIFYVKS